MSNPTGKNQYSGGGKKAGPPKLKLRTAQKVSFSKNAAAGAKGKGRSKAFKSSSVEHKLSSSTNKFGIRLATGPKSSGGFGGSGMNKFLKGH